MKAAGCWREIKFVSDLCKILLRALVLQFLYRCLGCFGNLDF